MIICSFLSSFNSLNVTSLKSLENLFLKLGGNLEEIEEEVIVNEIKIQIPPHRPICDDSVLKKALEAIQTASKPIIVAGGGARHSGCSKELLKFA